MAAVALVKKVRREGREVQDSGLDTVRNVCRCDTHTRIREAIEQGARNM
jgi:isoquinoline 1-oxidoreductase alpha subunit